MGTWKSSRTPKTSEFDCRGQNISPWGVLHVIGKLLKCRCRKWPRMNHLDVCSTSYGKKKGRGVKLVVWFLTTKSRESTRPHVWRWSAIHRWKALNESYNFSLNLIPIRGMSKELWTHKVLSPNWDSFGTPSWESRDKKPFRCGCRGVTQRILYGGRWWLPPSLGCGESCEFRVARDLF
jgi:hypothetical protein